VSDQTIVSGGVERVFQLDVPASYDGTTPTPVVLGLHALTVSYTFVAPLGGFADERAAYDFILVSPSGRLDGSTPFWYAAPTEDNYDVTFFGDLLDHLEATLCIDPSRVFSTGMSNGAQMSSLLACRLSDRITAIAPIAGVEFLEPCDGDPVPVLAFHGSADPILPYEGGGLNATTIANTQYWKGNIPPGMPAPLGVDESMRRWAEHNGCDPTPVEERISAEVRRRTWTGCVAATVLYVVDGGGHAWPGRPQPAFEAAFGHCTTDIDATALMFSFFLDGAAG
jgi:polyhydroxybutyrate depolymerase